MMSSNELQQAFREYFGRDARAGELEHPYFIACLRRNGADRAWFSPRQLAASEVLTIFPRIALPGGPAALGGDQNWYAHGVEAPLRSIEAYSGCGIVSACDVLAAFAYGDDALAARIGLKFFYDGTLDFKDFLRWMKMAYRRTGTMEVPVLAGRFQRGKYLAQHRASGGNKKMKRRGIPPSLGMWGAGYVRGVLRLAGDYDLRLKAHSKITLYGDGKAGLAFIERGLAAGSPVDILTSFNAHDMMIYEGDPARVRPTKKAVNIHHHVVAVGVNHSTPDGDPEILVSTWGALGVIPYSALHRSWQNKNAFASGLYWFEHTADQNAARASVRRSRTEMPRNLGRLLANGVRGIWRRITGNRKK